MANVNASAPDPKTRKTKKAMPSRKKAIEDMCKQCVYDPKADGTWRMQCQNCCGFSCPLYPVRPVSTINTESDDE